MKVSLLTIVVALSTGLLAQNAIPSGTILPLRLSSSLNSEKSKPGQAITARIMQDVPLAAGSAIHAGTRVVGHVVSVTPANGGSAEVSLRFDTLMLSNRMVPITTNLRALASMMEVQDAELPKSGPDEGTPSTAWTTVQVGGDVVYRGGGPVTNGSQIVGSPVYDGVLSRLTSVPGTECGCTSDSKDRPQALWVFSSGACGTYGLADVRITHTGWTNPTGEITLSSNKGALKIRSGSGMLLLVNDRSQ